MKTCHLSTGIWLGKTRPAQIFVAVMGASNFTYAEASFVQDSLALAPKADRGRSTLGALRDAAIGPLEVVDAASAQSTRRPGRRRWRRGMPRCRAPVPPSSQARASKVGIVFHLEDNKPVADEVVISD